MTQPKRGSLREPQSSVLSTRKHSVVLFEIYHTLGWSEIEVIDDDLGRSAAGGV
jgi:hypothetical protein